MLIEDELVEVKWHNNSKSWYESRGYKFTHNGDYFYVKSQDVHPGARIKVTVKCDYCGKIYKKNMCDYTKSIKNNQLVACKRCTGIKSGQTRIYNSKEDVVSQFNKYCEEKGYEPITNTDSYYGVTYPFYFICPKHGLQSVSFGTIRVGGGCIKCGFEKSSKIRKSNIECIKSYIESLNNNIWLNPQEYISQHEKNLKIKCGSCGETFTTRFSVYKTIGTGKCPNCGKKRSRAEYTISSILDKHNIIYVQEKCFSDCRDKRPLPFDFYLPEYNLCIEFDGQGHYEPKFGEHSLKQTIYHDNIKNKYCVANDINLLRIPYWDGNNMEQTILNKIDEISINLNKNRRYSLVS